MGKMRLYLILWGVANSVVQEFLFAMMDKVLDGVELLRIIKTAIMSLRLSGVLDSDVDQIQLITSKAEHDALDFVDGDAVLFLPKELVEKLKIDFDKI